MNPQRPTTDEAKSEEPDDREPTPECQTELRAAYDANVAADKVPYRDMGTCTQGTVKDAAKGMRT